MGWEDLRRYAQAIPRAAQSVVVLNQMWHRNWRSFRFNLVLEFCVDNGLGHRENLYRKNIWLYVNRSKVNSINQKNSKKFKRIWHVNKKRERIKNRTIIQNDWRNYSQLKAWPVNTRSDEESHKGEKIGKKKLSKLIIFCLFSFAFGVLVKNPAQKSPSATKPCINQHTQFVQRMKFKMVPKTQLTKYDWHIAVMRIMMIAIWVSSSAWVKWLRLGLALKSEPKILRVLRIEIDTFDRLCVSAGVCEKVEFEFSTPLDTIPISSD